MTTGNRFLYVTYAALFALFACIFYALDRLAQMCFVQVNPPLVLAQAEPGPMYLIAIMEGLCLGFAVVLLAIGFTRPAGFACPHCAKQVEPRWSVTGLLSGRAGHEDSK